MRQYRVIDLENGRTESISATTPDEAKNNFVNRHGGDSVGSRVMVVAESNLSTYPNLDGGGDYGSAQGSPEDRLEAFVHKKVGDEDEDKEKYQQMAMLAADNNHLTVARVLEDIAEDESRHYRKLQRLMNKYSD